MFQRSCGPCEGGGPEEVCGIGPAGLRIVDWGLSNRTENTPGLVLEVLNPGVHGAFSQASVPHCYCKGVRLPLALIAPCGRGSSACGCRPQRDTLLPFTPSTEAAIAAVSVLPLPLRITKKSLGRMAGRSPTRIFLPALQLPLHCCLAQSERPADGGSQKWCPPSAFPPTHQDRTGEFLRLGGCTPSPSHRKSQTDRPRWCSMSLPIFAMSQNSEGLSLNPSHIFVVLKMEWKLLLAVVLQK